MEKGRPILNVVGIAPQAGIPDYVKRKELITTSSLLLDSLRCQESQVYAHPYVRSPGPLQCLSQ